MTSFPPSFFDHLEDRLNLAVYDTNQEWYEMNVTTHGGRVFRSTDQAQPEEAAEAKVVVTVTVSPINRLKDKLSKASGVAQRVSAGIESEADALIAAEDTLKAKTQGAFAPHKAILAEAHTELQAIEDALNIMSNGGPPLTDAANTAPGSN